MNSTLGGRFVEPSFPWAIPKAGHTKQNPSVRTKWRMNVGTIFPHEDSSIGPGRNYD